MDIAQFIPNYPLIRNADEKYSFNESIFDKKEFYELKLHPNERTQIKNSNLFDNQELLRRFMSPYTLYDEMLLFWEPGTGKTIGSLGVAENIITSPNTSIHKAIVLVSNDDLMKKFIGELVKLTGDKYKPILTIEDTLGKSPTEIKELYQHKLEKNVSQFYLFTTRQTFFNRNRSYNTEQLAQHYSNHIVIIDEVHNIIGLINNSLSPIYNFYHHLFHSIKNSRILLLTGTPMKNNAFDFAVIMNLILPIVHQLPIKNAFDTLFLENGTITAYGRDKLLKTIRGRVSYIQKIRSSVNIIYEGELIPPLKFLDVVPSQMRPFQNNIVLQTWSGGEWDDVESEQLSGWRNRERQASLFVFPDGSIQKIGFETFFKFVKGVGMDRYEPSDAWKLIFRSKTLAQKLELIDTFSCKYATIIRTILQSRREKCFIYNESIKEGGSIVLGQCLHECGFQEVKGGVNFNQNRPRFAILSSQVIPKQNINKIINAFNSSKNKYGQYLQVLIGGRGVSEGHSFRNIQQIHIATPHWNFPRIDQAIARGIRAKSHDKDISQVKIYRHVALSDPIEQSIDLIIYQRGEDKDFIIKRMERIIEEGTWDCALNFDRNKVLNEEDGTRACKYQSCDFLCEGVEFPYTRTDNQLDKSTWNLYYNQDQDQNIHDALLQLFKDRFSISIPELIKTFPEYNEFSLLRVLKIMISEHSPIRNRFGIETSLHYSENQIFVSSSINLTQELSQSYYTQFPMLFQNKSFISILNQTYYSMLDTTIQNLCSRPTLDQLYILENFPKQIQSLFLEKAVDIAGANDKNLNSWGEAVLDLYRPYIVASNNKIYSKLLLSDGILRVWTADQGWNNADVDNEKIMLSSFIEGNELGYYIRFNQNTGQMNIVTLTGRLEKDYRSNGQNCTTMNLQKKLLPLVKKLNLDVENKNKLTLCNVLFDFFKQRNLVYYV